MAAPTRGREDDGRDLAGSGDPGRTGRGCGACEGHPGC